MTDAAEEYPLSKPALALSYDVFFFVGCRGRSEYLLRLSGHIARFPPQGWPGDHLPEGFRLIGWTGQTNTRRHTLLKNTTVWGSLKAFPGAPPFRERGKEGRRCGPSPDAAPPIPGCSFQGK
jgi:hypothetical protein